MISGSDIICVQLRSDTLKIVKDMAKKAELGGVSRIREDVDRKLSLSEDQIAGQLGECALSILLFNDIEPYLVSRSKKNRDPSSGDCGSDIFGSNVDVKTSIMRGSLDPLDYRLLVRPKERHNSTVYFLALVPTVSEEQVMVNMIGWVRDSCLPSTTESSGPFSGAFVVPARDLYPITPIFWKRDAVRNLFKGNTG